MEELEEEVLMKISDILAVLSSGSATKEAGETGTGIGIVTAGEADQETEIEGTETGTVIETETGREEIEIALGGTEIGTEIQRKKKMVMKSRSKLKRETTSRSKSRRNQVRKESREKGEVVEIDPGKGVAAETGIETEEEAGIGIETGIEIVIVTDGIEVSAVIVTAMTNHLQWKSRRKSLKIFFLRMVSSTNKMDSLHRHQICLPLPLQMDSTLSATMERSRETHQKRCTD